MLAQILVPPDFDENENLEYSRFEILQKENSDLVWKKLANPGPVDVAAGVRGCVSVAGSLCGRAESAFCV